VRLLHAGGGDSNSILRLGFLRKLKSLPKRQRRIFLIVSVAGFFNNYDGALVNLALIQIQRGLRIVETALGPMAAVITLGSVLAPLITSQADRRGRRVLLLSTLAAFSLLSGLTAFAWNVVSFVVLRFLTVTFSAAEGSIALVILVEETNAGARGLVVGLLGMITAYGYGVAALAFAWIAVIPFGWRALFIVSLIPLLLIVPLWHLLPESSLYETSSKRMGSQDFLAPFRALIRSYPGRFGATEIVTFLNAMGGTPAGLFQSKYLQEVHAWTPADVSMLIFAGGAVGILGGAVGGHLSDHLGRRMVGAIFIAFAPVVGVVFFNTSGLAMVAAWTATLFGQTAGSAILNAFSAELFPTSYRSTANSAIAVAATLGGSAGLMLESWLYDMTNTHWRAVSLLMSASILAAIGVALLFPETAGAELDAVSPERSLLRRRHHHR
jgi:MFS transporter, putative metabolite:H+ symporter